MNQRELMYALAMNLAVYQQMLNRFRVKNAVIYPLALLELVRASK